MIEENELGRSLTMGRAKGGGRHSSDLVKRILSIITGGKKGVKNFIEKFVAFSYAKKE